MGENQVCLLETAQGGYEYSQESSTYLSWLLAKVILHTKKSNTILGSMELGINDVI